MKTKYGVEIPTDGRGRPLRDAPGKYCGYLAAMGSPTEHLPRSIGVTPQQKREGPPFRELDHWNSDLNDAVDSACNSAEDYEPGRRKAFLQQLAQAIEARAAQCGGCCCKYLEELDRE